MDPRSLVAVPLVARGQCIGAITLFRSTMVPPLDETGMVIAEQIAAPAALAIDNARRFEAAGLRGLAPTGASPSGKPSPGEKPAAVRRRAPASRKARAGERRKPAAPKRRKGARTKGRPPRRR
jgi:hypothetical protein